MTALILVGTLFLGGNEAHAHNARHNHRPPATQVQINFHWVWVNGHWSHGSWVKGHWSRRPGHHPRAHQHDMRWIPGHYEGRGPRRHWVPGHWKRK